MTTVKIRRRFAGSYEWKRKSDGAVIMTAERGVLDHDPRAWLVTLYSKGGTGEDWTTDDNEVVYTLRAAKGLAADWAQSLVKTGDLGWSPGREY